jgi:cation diffusion facilitator family transporter
MGASVAGALLVLGGKGVAYALTGSAAILSDAGESVTHVLATGFAAFSLWYADEPPDPGHPYGHGKVAYLAAGAQGGMILLAAIGILYAAGRAFIEGPALHELGVGLAITGGVAAFNLALGRYLVHVGRRTDSLVLVANGEDVLTDMWTSAGVLTGVGLVWLTGVAWLDPLVAALVALNILWTAYELMRRAVAGLMEKVHPETTRRIVGALEEAEGEGLIEGFHQVRHRRVENILWIDCHLLFPDAMSVAEAHRRTTRVEARLEARFENAEVHVTAHLEPAAHAHPDHHREPADPLVEEKIEGKPP